MQRIQYFARSAQWKHTRGCYGDHDDDWDEDAGRMLLVKPQLGWIRSDKLGPPAYIHNHTTDEDGDYVLRQDNHDDVDDDADIDHCHNVDDDTDDNVTFQASWRVQGAEAEEDLGLQCPAELPSGKAFGIFLRNLGCKYLIDREQDGHLIFD